MFFLTASRKKVGGIFLNFASLCVLSGPLLAREASEGSAARERLGDLGRTAGAKTLVLAGLCDQLGSPSAPSDTGSRSFVAARMHCFLRISVIFATFGNILEGLF